MKTVNDLLQRMQDNPGLEDQIKAAARAASSSGASSQDLEVLFNEFAETPTELALLRSEFQRGNIGDAQARAGTTTTTTLTTVTSIECLTTTTTTTLSNICVQEA